MGGDPGLPALGARHHGHGPGGRRGADRHPGRRGGARPPRAAAARALRRLGPGRRRLRPDRRDAAAARAARGARLVHAARLPGPAAGGQGAAAGADPRRRGPDAGRQRLRARSSGCTPSSTRSGSLLSGPDASVRIVLTPEAVVLAEARRAYTTLSLFGYRVDGVVANRVFPAEGADDWRAGWVLAQDEVLAQVAGVVRRRAAVALGVPRRRAGRRRGAGDAGRASCTTAPTRSRTSGVRSPFEVVTVRGGVQLRLRLPFVTRDQVDLARSGDELVVTVGSYRRLLTLPAGLARLRVAGARVDDEGVLRVSFKDPAADRRKERGRMTPPRGRAGRQRRRRGRQAARRVADWAATGPTGRRAGRLGRRARPRGQRPHRHRRRRVPLLPGLPHRARRARGQPRGEGPAGHRRVDVPPGRGRAAAPPPAAPEPAGRAGPAHRPGRPTTRRADEDRRDPRPAASTSAAPRSSAASSTRTAPSSRSCASSRRPPTPRRSRRRSSELVTELAVAPRDRRGRRRGGRLHRQGPRRR